MEWLNGYSGQSPAALIALKATHRVDSIVLAFEQALQEKALLQGSDALSETERAVIAIEAMEREVNNGGWGQLFKNEPLTLSASLPAQLLAIGCPVTADIAARALAARASVEELPACDSAYYNAGENIAGLLFNWLETRLDSIRFAPPA